MCWATCVDADESKKDMSSCNNRQSCRKYNLKNVSAKQNKKNKKSKLMKDDTDVEYIVIFLKKLFY